jgi:hypothetical protein
VQSQNVNAFGGSSLVAKYWHGVFCIDVSTMKNVAIEASPMYHVHKVAKGSSIALYYGENDRRGPIEHSYHTVGVKEMGDSWRVCIISW